METRNPRYLTKSAFKTASECPSKLNYLKHPEYPSTKQDNDFLRALADGGFQVGELAKIYHPGGIMIETLDYDEAIARTEELLKRPEVVIYEAAFRFESFFVRVDVLIKNKSGLDLVEVKAKSYDGTATGPETFWNRDGKTLTSKWEPYLLDVAFQKWVAAQAHPEFCITPHLMLADKSALASIDGINQRFVLLSKPADSTTRVRVAPGTTREVLGQPLLCQVKVENEVQYLLTKKYGERTFDQHVRWLSEHYTQGKSIPATLSRECRSCEYRIPPEKEGTTALSGFKRCWTEAGGLEAQDFDRPLAIDIWKLHYMKKDAWLAEQRYFMDQLEPEDLEPKSKSKGKAKRPPEIETDISPDPGLTNTQRQWLQVERATATEPRPYLDLPGLAAQFKDFDFPYHFIDFETSRAAIPYHKGRRPYEQIAFQFSHHQLNADGSIEHKDQFISFEPGEFPNYQFVRALKTALEKDNGTIFRYADHENTVLREIAEQLSRDPEPPADAQALVAFIDSITHLSKEKGGHAGPRDMVDLKWLVQKFYYSPLTQGSNSIKAVLPAILTESEFLQRKYDKPVYGAQDGMSSLNFNNHAWITYDENGEVKDPYKTLQPIFQDIEPPSFSFYNEEDRVAEGGAAMTAFARMQFTEMSSEERLRVRDALLRYCELDTLAMVMLCEHWLNALRRSSVEPSARPAASREQTQASRRPQGERTAATTNTKKKGVA